MERPASIYEILDDLPLATSPGRCAWYLIYETRELDRILHVQQERPRDATVLTLYQLHEDKVVAELHERDTGYYEYYEGELTWDDIDTLSQWAEDLEEYEPETLESGTIVSSRDYRCTVEEELPLHEAAQ